MRPSRRLGKIERAIKGLLTLVEQGGDPASVISRLNELAAERARIDHETRNSRPEVIDFHPGIAERYRTIVRDLRASLGGPRERKAEVIASVRAKLEQPDALSRHPAEDGLYLRFRECTKQ